MWRCGRETTGLCTENAEHFYEVLHCERFHKDMSGPWAMISDGMSIHSKCGALAVNVFAIITTIDQLIWLKWVWLIEEGVLNRFYFREILNWQMPNWRWIIWQILCAMMWISLVIEWDTWFAKCFRERMMLQFVVVLIWSSMLYLIDKIESQKPNQKWHPKLPKPKVI